MKSDCSQRLLDIHQFYELLNVLENKCGNKRQLKDSHGKMNWPKRGIYFFFEPGEMRSTSRSGARVVRIGTHALKAGSKSTLWKRLKQHKGTQNDGGNHRGSVFRKHVGSAMLRRDHWPDLILASWDKGSSAAREIRDAEKPLEQAVSQYICCMPFLWLEVDDLPVPNSMRGYLERNSIALLSNDCMPDNPIDPSCKGWLGLYAKSEEIRRSGLWNLEHVHEEYDPAFLDLLERLIF